MTEFETQMLELKKREVIELEKSNNINKITTIGGLIMLEDILRDYSKMMLKLANGDSDDVIDDLNSMFDKLNNSIENLKQDLYDI